MPGYLGIYLQSGLHSPLAGASHTGRGTKQGSSHLINQACDPVLGGAASILMNTFTYCLTNLSARKCQCYTQSPQSEQRQRPLGIQQSLGVLVTLKSRHSLGPTVPRGVPRCPDTALTLGRVESEALALQKCCPAWPDPTKPYLEVRRQPVQQEDNPTTLSAKPSLPLFLAHLFCPSL